MIVYAMMGIMAVVTGLVIARLYRLEKALRLVRQNQQCLDDKFAEAVPTITDHVLAILKMPELPSCEAPERAVACFDRPAKVIPIRPR